MGCVGLAWLGWRGFGNGGVLSLLTSVCLFASAAAGLLLRMPLLLTLVPLLLFVLLLIERNNAE